ncbi:MAG: phage/plasmid primase, P4 family [Thermoleophilia bacterium]
MNGEHIPAELRDLEQWLCWRREQRGGKSTKVPVDPNTGALAKTNDPATWGSYDDALVAVERFKCNGIGFVFGPDDPYAGVDLDDCIDEDGALGRMAQEIVDGFATYTEVSPSGKGLHCILRAKVPSGARKQGLLGGQPVEVYSEGRFFCMTGNSITNGTPINDAQPQLEGLCQRLAEKARDNGDTKLGEGEGRNNELTRVLGSAVALGIRGKALRSRAEEINSGFDPPLAADEVAKVLHSAAKWPVGGHHRSDSGNAERLIATCGERIRFCPPWGAWLVWDGCRWAKDDSLQIEHLTGLALRSIHNEAARATSEEARRELGRWALASESAQRRRAAIECARSDPRIVVRPAEFDADPWRFNCLNGTLDLRTGDLRNHDRRDLITKLAPVVYDPAARLDLWERVLREATEGNAAMMAFLARLAGYSLTGLISEEKLPFIFGPEATAKSTFLEALKSTWGDYAQTADFESFLKRSGVGAPRSDLARLAGARLVVSIETEANAHLAGGLVKMITGGDRVVARRLYQEEFEFRPQFTLWWAANDAPKMSDRDGALWRRIVQIPFIHQIAKQERDPQVKAILTDPTSAGAAILAWAVRGCLAWQREGLGVPPAVEQATAALRAEMDPLRDFFAERCAFEDQALTSSKQLFAAYRHWAAANNDDKPLSRREFGLRIGERLGRKPLHGRDGDRWPGVRLLAAAAGEESLDLEAPR